MHVSTGLWKWKWRDIRPSKVTHTLNSCSAFNPSKVHTTPPWTHTQQCTHTPWNTHTMNTHTAVKHTHYEHTHMNTPQQWTHMNTQLWTQHTAVNTHTMNTHGAVGSHLCCGARGTVGFGASRVSPQPWYWRWRECSTSNCLPLGHDFPQLFCVVMLVGVTLLASTLGPLRLSEWLSFPLGRWEGESPEVNTNRYSLVFNYLKPVVYSGLTRCYSGLFVLNVHLEA